MHKKQRNRSSKSKRREAKSQGINQLKKHLGTKNTKWTKRTENCNYDIDIVKTNQRLKSVGLKAETEVLIIAAQDQKLSSKHKNESIYGLCEQKTVHFPVLTPIERHNKIITWEIHKSYRIQKSEKWHKYQLEPITEAKEATIPWDFIMFNSISIFVGYLMLKPSL